MDLQQQVAQGLIWSFIHRWGSRTLSVVVFFLLARLLGPEAFGLIALAALFISFIETFIDQGFSSAIVQRRDLDSEHLDTAFWTSLGVSITVAVLGVAGAGFIANLFSEPRVEPILRWLSLSFPLTALASVQVAILRRNFAFKVIAARSLIGVVAGGAVGVTMALLNCGVWSLVGQQLSMHLAGVLLLWSTCEWRPKPRFSKQRFQELLSFGINIVGSRILEFVNTNSDNFLIGYFLGPVALGYYTVGYRVLQLMVDLLNTTIEQVALPAFAKMQHDIEQVQRGFYLAIRLTSFVAFPLFCGMSVLAPELIQILFGQQWLPSVPVMQTLAFIGMLNSIYYFKGSVLVAMGKPAWNLGIACVNAIVNVIAFTLVVHWGIVAVAAAFVIRGYLLSPLAFYAVHKLIQIKLVTYLNQLKAPLIGSLLAAATILITKYFLGSSIDFRVLLPLNVVLGVVVYAGVVRLVSPKLIEEVAGLVGMLKRPKNLKKA